MSSRVYEPEGGHETDRNFWDDEWLKSCDDLLRQGHPICKRLAKVINEALGKFAIDSPEVAERVSIRKKK